MFDFLIVGAGFSGAVLAERIATQLKKRVLIIEKRNHIGGNCYDHYNNEGLLVHKYGPRIFHTDSKLIWDYLGQFTEWQAYQNKVVAQVNGVLIPFPFNLNSIKILFPAGLAEQLTNKLMLNFNYDAKVSLDKLRALNDSDLSMLADFIYHKIYLNYTLKQWGVRPDELDRTIVDKMFVQISFDDRYTQDTYQGIPLYGYNQLFKKMLNHDSIKVMLNTDYREILTINHHTRQIKFMEQDFMGKLIFTGKIDELFDFCFGELPYRTVDFNVKTLHKQHYQEVASINYPNEYDFTRVTEVKYLTGQHHPYTAIVEEYHRASTRKDIPYFPIPTAANLELFVKYQQLALEYSNLILAGQLAEYHSYSMNTAVAMSLDKFKELKKQC